MATIQAPPRRRRHSPFSSASKNTRFQLLKATLIAICPNRLASTTSVSVHAAAAPFPVQYPPANAIKRPKVEGWRSAVWFDIPCSPSLGRSFARPARTKKPSEQRPDGSVRVRASIARHAPTEQCAAHHNGDYRRRAEIGAFEKALCRKRRSDSRACGDGGVQVRGRRS